MSTRLAVLLVILGLGLLVAIFAWPSVDRQAITADLKIALLTQPRAEIFISGFIKNAQASAFSLETLLIEEPGKEPYRRQVALDANRSFELALGPPAPGTYRVSAKTSQANWQGKLTEDWLQTPHLVVSSSAAPHAVRATNYNYRRLLVFLSLVTVVEAALLVAWIKRPKTATAATGSPDVAS